MATVSEARSVVAIAHAAIAAEKSDRLTKPADRTLTAFLLGIRVALANPAVIGAMSESLDIVPGREFPTVIERFDIPGFVGAVETGMKEADADPNAATLAFGLLALSAL